jgi:hypothetical protein
MGTGESLKEVFSRPEVKYFLSLKESRWRRYYRRFFARKYIGLFYLYSFQWAYHRWALTKVTQDFNLRASEMEVIMALFSTKQHWGTDVAGQKSVFKAFFEGQMSASVYESAISSLKRKGIIYRLDRRRLNPTKKEIVNAVAINNEQLIMFTDAGDLIPREYDIALGHKFKEFSGLNDNFKPNVVSMFDAMIKLRDEIK